MLWRQVQLRRSRGVGQPKAQSSAVSLLCMVMQCKITGARPRWLIAAPSASCLLPTWLRAWWQLLQRGARLQRAAGHVEPAAHAAPLCRLPLTAAQPPPLGTAAAPRPSAAAAAPQHPAAPPQHPAAAPPPPRRTLRRPSGGAGRGELGRAGAASWGAAAGCLTPSATACWAPCAPRCTRWAWS